MNAESNSDSEPATKKTPGSRRRGGGRGRAGGEAQKTPPPAPAAEGPQKSTAGIGMIALVLSLLALLAVGYSLYEIKVTNLNSSAELGRRLGNLDDRLDLVNDKQVALESAQKNLDDRQLGLRESQTSLDSINQTVDLKVENARTELESRLVQYQARIDQALKDYSQSLDSRFNELHSSVSKVSQDLDRSLDAWSLEELEQLLMLANQRLTLAGDVDSAVAALEIADDKLARLADPALADVRKLVTGELSELSAVPDVDIEGMALVLATLASDLDQWPLKRSAAPTFGPPDDADEAPRTSSGEATATGDGSADRPMSEKTMDAISDSGRKVARFFSDIGEAMVEDVKEMVRIQNNQEAHVALLAPEQRYFLYENVRLMLLGAEQAVLMRSQPVFDSNVEQARAWINRYFDVENSAVAKALEQLAEMGGVTLERPLPSVSESLGALRDVIKSRSGQ